MIEEYFVFEMQRPRLLAQEPGANCLFLCVQCSVRWNSEKPPPFYRSQFSS